MEDILHQAAFHHILCHPVAMLAFASVFMELLILPIGWYDTGGTTISIIVLLAFGNSAMEQIIVISTT